MGTSEKISKGAIAQRLETYASLKQALEAFVLDAEGDLATALEAFSAEHLGRWSQPSLSGLDRSALAVDMFITEGQVAGQSVIDRFLASAAANELSALERTWLGQWAATFNGLFVVRGLAQTEGASTPSESFDGDFSPAYGLMNWMSEKNYRVYANAAQRADMVARLSPGEIVLARLSPLDEKTWTFSGPLTLLGKLGEPKLAVAIGNFRKWFPHHLYGDAPDLEAAAWESVEKQYDDLLTLFGATQVTLPGRELDQKFQRYQETAMEQRLAAAGLDSSKSLQEMAQEAGLSDAEVAEALSAVGEESKAAEALLKSRQSLKMVMPKVKLPDEIRRAAAVTVFIHPRWGQTFLSDYGRLESLLKQSPAALAHSKDDQDRLDRLLQKYLTDERVNAHVWQCLAREYEATLAVALGRVLGKPGFDLNRDLRDAIAQYGKSVTPQLPESASVPEHLHHLFSSALAAVGKRAGGSDELKKGAKKGKAKPKKTGFGA